jgi:hypothetical protein
MDDALLGRVLGWVGYDKVVENMFLELVADPAGGGGGECRGGGGDRPKKAYLAIGESKGKDERPAKGTRATQRWGTLDLSHNLDRISKSRQGAAAGLGLRFLAFKAGVVLTTLFLFFTTTSLVSFTLRSTQNRMLRFTFLLQQLVTSRRPYTALVFQHVLSSLIFVPVMVGILFFLLEFFDDHLLAVAVLTIVWVCEVYTVVCMRTLEVRGGV